MKPATTLACALGLFAAPAGAAKPAPPPSLTLPVPPGGNPHLPVRVNDAELDIRIALSFDTALVLNEAPAQRAGLKSFPLIGKRTFKNALIPGGEATFRFNFKGITPRGLPSKTVPVVWVSRPVSADADGVLTVGALKTDRVIFDLGPVKPGSQTIVLKRKGSGETGIKARVGDEDIDVALELNSPDTVMNARAAQALMAAGVAKRAKQVGYWRPFPNVALPFQRLDATPGARLLGLPLRRMGARVSEAEARRIDAEARGTSTESDDDDTITVTASRKKKGRDPWLLIGRDVLSDCSRIEFDRPGERWVLTCAFGA